MRKLKIFHIIPTLTFGGAEKICIDLATQQAKEHDVAICTLHDRNKSWRLLPDSRVKEVSVNSKRSNIFVYWNVFKLMLKERPDVIHGHVGGIIYTLLFGIYNLFRGKRSLLVYTFHTLPEKDLSPFHQKVLKKQIGFLKVIPVAISMDIQQRVCDTYQLMPDRVKLVINGVGKPSTTTAFADVQATINSLKPHKNTVVYIHVARICAVKNQLLLVNAFKDQLLKGANAILIIIGDVQDQGIFDELKNLAENDRIYLLGVKSNVSDYMQCADFLCFTSVYEGLPLAMIEGFANGLAILSTPFSGVERIITDGCNGLIAQGFEIQQYSDIIRKSMELPEEVYSIMSANAQSTYMELYTLDICVKKYLRIYEGEN